MGKRILLVLVALVLLLGGVLVALRFLRRGEALPSPPEQTRGDLPESGERALLEQTTPEVRALSLACPERWAGLPDGDGDELPDEIEQRYLTDQAAPDTDHDGFSDGAEVRAGYHPLQKEGNPRLDSDHDGLFENEECQWTTDPFLADTDGDGFRDGDEVTNGFDPAVKGDGQGSDALPSRRAKESQVTLERLRPNPASENYTEGLAGILTQGKSPSELQQTQVTPQQVEEILSTARLNTTLPNIPLTEIRVGTTNTSADVRAYLENLTTARPRDLGDAATITNALTSALAGNTGGLKSLRSHISAYEQALRGIATPPSAVEHQRTLIAVTRFVNDRLGEAEASAGRDPVKAYLALRALQVGLPTHLQTLQAVRAQLETLAGQ